MVLFELILDVTVMDKKGRGGQGVGTHQRRFLGVAPPERIGIIVRKLFGQRMPYPRFASCRDFKYGSYVGVTVGTA